MRGDAARLGFDGDGGDGVLAFRDEATLAFVFDESGVSGIGEFRSGRFGADAPEIGSRVRVREDARLILDLRELELDGESRSFTLIDADTLSGRFAEHEALGLGQGGLGGARLSYDREAGDLTLELTPSGLGEGLEVFGL